MLVMLKKQLFNIVKTLQQDTEYADFLSLG